MSDVNVQLVRECFELNHFRVMTHWQHDSGRPRSSDSGFQLYVESTAPVPDAEPDFVLRPGDIPAIQRAAVEVRAWHAERFYASVIESNPVLLQVAEATSLARAAEVFDGAAFTTVLVISELPTSPEPRQRAVDLLKGVGIGHVLEFPVLVQDVLERLNAHASYAPSHTLQTLRLLKRYKFIRRQQLEFAFPTEPPSAAQPPHVETASSSTDKGADDADAPD